jgi:ketosteroid isomerase-like protein
MNTNLKTGVALTEVNAPADTLQSALTALSNGQISKAVDLFDKKFTFSDQALQLEFQDKGQLSEYFQKLRELFPDTVIEVISTFECGDHVIAEWRVTASEIASYFAQQIRLPILLSGVSVVHIENGRITRWTDYYDKNASRRIKLAAFFTEWIAY